jgi:hypothetical protein
MPPPIQKKPDFDNEDETTMMLIRGVALFCASTADPGGRWTDLLALAREFEKYILEGVP